MFKVQVSGFEWLRRFLKNRAVARLYKVSVCFKFKVQGCQDAKKTQNLVSALFLW